MKRLVLILVIAVLFFSLVSSTSAASYANVSVYEAKAMIDSNPSLVVLDVRTQSEYDSGHIRNTMHIPLAELGGRLDELNVNDEFLVYCASGGRSASASQLLVDNGFLYISNMLGGITAWISAGYPVYVKYSSIQEAINYANEGDTIFVSSGTYNENVVVNKTISLIGESSSVIVDGDGGFSGFAIETYGVNISCFTIQNAFLGIDLANAHDCNIMNNTVSNLIGHGNTGINTLYSFNCTLSNNVITSNFRGMHFDRSENFTVSNNKIEDNQDFGVRLLDCKGFRISENTIEGNPVFGIQICRSQNNLVSGNSIAGAACAVWIEWSSSVVNRLFHNNIMMGHVDIDSWNNTWDNGCEGNFWSNYNGTDLNGDGIGDTNLPWEGVDSYPLMNLYWTPGDIDHDLDVDIFDVVKCAIAYGSTPLDVNWNPHCDIAEPYGIINIFDIVTIASSYGKEYTP